MKDVSQPLTAASFNRFFICCKRLVLSVPGQFAGPFLEWPLLPATLHDTASLRVSPEQGGKFRNTIKNLPLQSK